MPRDGPPPPDEKELAMIRSKSGEHAQGLVEFAFVLPVLLLLVFGIIDFGNALKSYITTSSAAREAARYASIGNASATSGDILCNSSPTNTVVLKACGTMGDLNAAYASVNVSCSTACTSGNTATITTQYKYYYITPIKGIVTFLSGGTLASYLSVSTTTSMRIE
jgi:Flp pilus assembly protein TadG